MNALSLVDAFADRPFTGNPAAVCLLSGPAKDEWMQSVAMEMNQAETAFVQPRDDGKFNLRWFTPKVEVDLCGHATLASAHVLWTEGMVKASHCIRFETASGTLTCDRRDDGRIELDFPAVVASVADPPAGLFDALGCAVGPVMRSRFDYLVVVEDERTLRNLKPNFDRLAGIEARGVIVTSVSNDPAFDFLSRFFAPAVGVNEDSVTGSAHCCLAPVWRANLGKNKMLAYQASPRGGRIGVEVRRDRVLLSGHARTTLKGSLCADL